ncbi:MAG: DotU family type IV/VI secretion system protein [Planctomycetota bacterium]
MRLAEACEPLFQYVCRLNRSARKGVHMEASVARSEVLGRLADVRSKVAGKPGMTDQFDKVELPLIYFVDFMIKESDASFAKEWKELAHERNKLAGDEEFFDLLDETLADSGPEAAERLEVFYTCMGLGFTGFYTGQPEYLRKKMMEISTRLRSVLEENPGSRVCPEAYQHTDTSDLIQPPGRSVVGIVIALAGLIVLLFTMNAYLYSSSARGLESSLRTLAPTSAEQPTDEGDGQ